MKINHIYQGNTLEVLKTFPDEVIDCVITSPPYWALRDYGVEGQLGLEPTFQEYITKLCDIFDEVKRTLKSTGTMWLNMGTTYSSLTIFSEYYIIREDLTKEELYEVKVELSRYLLGLWSASGKEAFKRNVLQLLSEEISQTRGKERNRENISSHLVSQKQRISNQENIGTQQATQEHNNSETGREVCLLRGKQTRIYDNRPYQRRRKKTLSPSDGTATSLSSDKTGGVSERQIQDTMLELQCLSGDMGILSSLKLKKSDIPPKLAKYFKPEYSIGRKNNLMLPSRVAIALQERGWILRSEIVWHKPNTMPSSVRDRFTIDFEMLYMFSKSEKYWFERQFEELRDPERLQRPLIVPENPRKRKIDDKWTPSINPRTAEASRLKMLKQGRNKRCVWTITTKPFKEAHFAVFPEELVETPLKSGCPEFVCNKCGKGREKIFEPSEEYAKKLGKGQIYRYKKRGIVFNNIKTGVESNKSVTPEYIPKGYTSCPCNAGFSGGIVLDPFCGSGTVGVVAKKLNRSFIGIDLNADYIKMANRRIANTECFFAGMDTTRRPGF